jgi:hypothetical protein
MCDHWQARKGTNPKHNQHEKEEMVGKRLSRHDVANSTCSLKAWTNFELMLTASSLVPAFRWTERNWVMGSGGASNES